MNADRVLVLMANASGDAEIRRLWHALSGEERQKVKRIVVALRGVVEPPEDDA